MNISKGFVILLIFILALPSLIMVKPDQVSAQTSTSPSTATESQGHITINGDGSVTPSTSSIQEIGCVYLLTTDMTQEVWVYRSNILFDGDGHTISGARLVILQVSNVTVKNLTVRNSYQGISLADSSNVVLTNNTVTGTGASLPFSETWAISIQRGNSNQIIKNNIVDNMVGFSFAETSDNLIVGNNITDCSSIAFGLYNSSNNRIYHNNLVNNSIQLKDEGVGLIPYMVSTNTWDNGSISGGNFWSDYKLKYPDSNEINHSGIWNTNYIIDQNNIDHYPLTQQVDIDSTTPSPKPIEPAILPMLSIAVIFAVAMIVVVGLLAYFKKRKR